MRSRSRVLAVVQARFEVEWSRPEWAADELVRRGAREARLLADDCVSVTVCADSRETAEALVRDLLERVGARAVETQVALPGRLRDALADPG